MVNVNHNFSAREKIKLSALLANSKLNKYIELHNTILRDAGSLRSFINNLFGIHVPFDQFVKRAEELEKEMKSIIDGLSVLKENIQDSMSSEEERYMNCLMNYADKLYQTISTLHERQEVYYHKSKGHKLDWSTARKLEDRYKQSIDNYKEVGKQLNDLSYLIF